MNIELIKISQHKCAYKIARNDKSGEIIELNTKTYFIHDISHYVVEKKLNFENGFWGMLSKGYKFQELFGKENELTEELRFVEQVVGPIQSVYMGYFEREDFNMLISHVNIEISDNVLDECIIEIERLIDNWSELARGGKITLKW